MRVTLGIDQLGVNANLVGRSPDTPFEHIANTELPADRFCIDWPVPVCESTIPRDHKHVRDPRQIGRQIVGEAVRKVLLVRIVAQVGKGQHDDRQGRRGMGADHGNPCRADSTIPRLPRHYRGKTVTAPGDSLDTTAARPTLIEDAAKRCDLDGQIIVLDHGPRPDRSHDLVLRYEIAVSLDKYTKHVQRARADYGRSKNAAF